MLIHRTITAWFLILLLAMINGLFREAVLLPSLSKPLSFMLSGLLLSALILLVTMALAHWLKLNSFRQCIATGLLWLVFTLLFEFGFGFAQGRSWPEMLAAYTFENGNIWPIVLAVTFFAPLMAARLRGVF